jgi:hypothetical protein
VLLRPPIISAPRQCVVVLDVGTNVLLQRRLARRSHHALPAIAKSVTLCSDEK